MNVLNELKERWKETDYPFLIHPSGSIYFNEILKFQSFDLKLIKRGQVVAIIGDFDPHTICIFLRLVDIGAIIVPLTSGNSEQHSYFFQEALVDVIIHYGKISFRQNSKNHPLLQKLRERKHPGLILFSTGTTGKPKAILHDFKRFLKRYSTPRPTYKTINFLLFDHIGGLNTLMHTLFNKGCVIAINKRDVETVLSICNKYQVELLPTTPTFLRLMLISGINSRKIPSSLKVITYGTERMDQITLDHLCRMFPKIDFRQTYGMSELGILRVKSEKRNSLFMKIGGEGVETKIVRNILYIKSENRMMGYLNANQPFDELGWYKTNDIIEQKDEFIKVVGRSGDVINVGGLKFMASEVEDIILENKDIKLATVKSAPNPITGNHVELFVEAKTGKQIDKMDLKKFLLNRLPNHMVPRRITITNLKINHRFKKS